MHEQSLPDTIEAARAAALQPTSRNFQSEFDSRYITSKEVLQYVGVTRPALFVARNKGYLPDAISTADGKVILWDREHIMPHLVLWRATIRRRNGESIE